MSEDDGKRGKLRFGDLLKSGLNLYYGPLCGGGGGDVGCIIDNFELIQFISSIHAAYLLVKTKVI